MWRRKMKNTTQFQIKNKFLCHSWPPPFLFPQKAPCKWNKQGRSWEIIPPYHHHSTAQHKHCPLTRQVHVESVEKKFLHTHGINYNTSSHFIVDSLLIFKDLYFLSSEEMFLRKKSSTARPRLTRITGPKNIRVNRNRTNWGQCYLVMVPKKAKNRVIPKIRVIVRLMLCSKGSCSTYVFFSVQKKNI